MSTWRMLGSAREARAAVKWSSVGGGRPSLLDHRDRPEGRAVQPITVRPSALPPFDQPGAKRLADPLRAAVQVGGGGWHGDEPGIDHDAVGVVDEEPPLPAERP